MDKIEKLERQINLIRERNSRVEVDKAWETSWTRKLIVAFLTYAVVVCFFVFAQLSDPFVNSIVPALAFVVSNLSLPMFQKIWVKLRKSHR